MLPVFSLSAQSACSSASLYFFFLPRVPQFSLPEFPLSAQRACGAVLPTVNAPMHVQNFDACALVGLARALAEILELDF